MSASAQQFATDETARTIASANLPAFTQSPAAVAKLIEQRLGLKLHYHFIDDQQNMFDSVLVEWAPDDRLFLSPVAAQALSATIAAIGDSSAVFDTLHELRNQMSGVYEVV